MRLLVFGHLSDTGFGVVTRELATRFLQAGHDVRVIAVNYRGTPVRGPLEGRVWPANLFGEQFGGNLSHEAVKGELWMQLDRTDDWKPEQALLIADVSSILATLGPRGLGAFLTIPSWHYCPIEGGNLPPGWADLWNHLRPIAMSSYGAAEIAKLLGRAVPMIYHGLAPDFRPATLAEPIEAAGKKLARKADCKRMFGLDPERLMILRTDRLVERKFYWSFLETLKPIFEKHPEVDAVIHCRPFDEGLDLRDEVSRLPQALWDRVKLTAAHDTFVGLPTPDLVALYNAADLYFSPTGGEGFGLTLGEALACGVPVVTTDYAAGPEVVGDGGILVPPLLDRYGNVVRYHSRYGMDWAYPDVHGFTGAVTRLVEKPSLRSEMGEAGRRHVRRLFDWDRSAKQFLDLFASVGHLEYIEAVV